MDNKQKIKILKALANNTRLNIIRMVNDNQGNICLYDLVESLNMPMTTVFIHVKKLESVDLLKPKQIGIKVLYSFNEKLFENFKSELDNLF